MKLKNIECLGERKQGGGVLLVHYTPIRKYRGTHRTSRVDARNTAFQDISPSRNIESEIQTDDSERVSAYSVERKKEN